MIDERGHAPMPHLCVDYIDTKTAVIGGLKLAVKKTGGSVDGVKTS